MTKIFAKLLKERGFDEHFLYPKYEDLFDPYDLAGIKAAVERIRLAVERKEKVLIYGDYDADGVTSSALLHDALTDFGCGSVDIILPDRFKDGYGLNMPAVDEIVGRGVSLVITVDCGSGSNRVIEELCKRGIDTIVTDHHEIPEVPAAAVAVVNPKQGDIVGIRMAGVGVAFTLARALNMAKNGGKCNGQEKWLMDLVAIGTICDSMELREENRILSYFGMKVLEKTRRPGIKELARVAKVDLSKVDTHAVGFQIGPRINAAGRMKSADLALDLVRQKSRTKAFALANEIDELNRMRRKTQEDAIREIELGDEKVIVVSGKWHEGVIGIIAGKLVEKYGKPAFVLTEVDGGVLKGSGRSFGDFSLAKVLQRCPDGLLLSGGGHAGACGLSLKKEKLMEFREFVNIYYEELGLKEQEKYLQIASDVFLDDFSEMSNELYEEIKLLEPFGEGNAEPIFEIEATIKTKRIMKDEHLALFLQDKNGMERKMLAFYAPVEWLECNEGNKVRALFTLSKNEFRDKTTIEGNIISLEIL